MNTPPGRGAWEDHTGPGSLEQRDKGRRKDYGLGNKEKWCVRDSLREGYLGPNHHTRRPEKTAGHGWAGGVRGAREALGQVREDFIHPAKANGFLLTTPPFRDYEKRVLGWKMHFRKITLFCGREAGTAGAGMVMERTQLRGYWSNSRRNDEAQKMLVLGALGRGPVS